MTAPSEALYAKARVVAVSGSLLGAAAAFLPRGLIFRANRIDAGDITSLVDALGGWGWTVVALWLTTALLSVSPLPRRLRGTVATATAGLIPVLVTWRSGAAATAHAGAIGDMARTSLGWTFWASLFASYIVIFAATAWMDRGRLRALLSYLPVLGIAVLITAGTLDELSIAREYANNSEEFAREFRLYLTYVVGAVGAGLAAGFALGLLAARRPNLEPAVFGTLNVLQVLPTLAFIGLMNPLLTALAAKVPVISALGIKGVGWAPVVIVLSVYATYPIARNTHAAITSLDGSVIDAARGVGMGRRRLLTDIEVPLAAPVIIAGLRVALVQTTAGAIIAGLVGGGGLGTFVFLGAGETATDLILLGVIPIVALALFFDRAVLGIQNGLSMRGRPA